MSDLTRDDRGTGGARSPEQVARDEEIRARIKAYADANGATMAEFAEGMRRLSKFLAGTSRSVGGLTAGIQSEAP